MSLSFNKVKTAVTVIVNSGHVPCIVGLQGIGKSDLVKEFAKDNDYEYEEITCSLLQEGDLAMPFLTGAGENSEVKYAINNIIKGLAERCISSGKKGILFLDELNRGSSNVQSELMNLVLQRKILGYALPNSIRIVVAMNPSSEMKGYEKTDYSVSFSDAAIWGRVVKLDMAPVLSEWLGYGKRIRPDGKPIVHEAISSYLSQNSKEFVTPEVSGEINNTPRGWSRTGDILYSCEELGITQKQLLYEMLKGTLREKTVDIFLYHYLNRTATTDYEKLAKGLLQAESVNDWDPSIGSMNDAELANLFTAMVGYCETHRMSGTIFNNMVQFLLAVTNELLYAWALDLQNSHIDLYTALVEDDTVATRLLGVLNNQNRGGGGFRGK